MAARSTRTTRRRRPLTPGQVIDVASDLADAEGLDQLTLTAVANRLGVRQPALYRHVASRGDLVRSLSLRGREVLVRRLTAAAIGRSGDDAVAAVGQAWRQMVRDHPGLYAATDRHPCAGDPELEAAVEQVLAVLARTLLSFGLDAEQGVHAARTLRSAFHGFSHLEAGDGHPLPHDPEETFDHLVQLLCAGIRELGSARAPHDKAGAPRAPDPQSPGGRRNDRVALDVLR